MGNRNWPNVPPQKTREEIGPREKDKDTHYDSCNGTECPCYQEGKLDAVKALKNQGVLMAGDMTHCERCKKLMPAGQKCDCATKKGY